MGVAPIVGADVVVTIESSILWNDCRDGTARIGSQLDILDSIERTMNFNGKADSL